MTGGRRLSDYRHKVGVAALARPPAGADPTFREWLEGFPGILAARDLDEVARRWVLARREGRPVALGMGAHVIKVGLAPWIITLLEEGLITHLAVNGAVAIHDFELASAGHTSEDVGEALQEGVFGRAEETALFIHGAARWAVEEGCGLGEALAHLMHRAGLPHGGSSLLAAAGRLGIPVSVHLALGTDTIHTHPAADGRHLGETSLRDFHLFARTVREMDGGLYLNAGSAVLLPEIFLKAVSLARAEGISLDRLTTAVLDFARHYRPLENVCRRPVRPGNGFYLVGHHELLIPLLFQAVRLRNQP
jgi:hypothetical protein